MNSYSHLRNTRRKYAAAVLLAAAVLILLGAKGWDLLLAWPAAAGGCLLALIPPARADGPPARGRAHARPGAVVIPSPVTTAPGRGSMLLAEDLAEGAAPELWLCHSADATTLGL